MPTGIYVRTEKHLAGMQNARIAYQKKMKEQSVERFWSKVDILQRDGCWIWCGEILWNGYGRFTVGGKRILAHRFAFQTVKGEIERELTIDHLCRNRSCVRPDHLEAVTSKENWLRGNSPPLLNSLKTHCVNGHSLWKNRKDRPGTRECIVCQRIRNRETSRARYRKEHPIAKWHKKRRECDTASGLLRQA